MTAEPTLARQVEAARVVEAPSGGLTLSTRSGRTDLLRAAASGIKLHDLRHFYASGLIAAGAMSSRCNGHSGSVGHHHAVDE